jgi:DNA modification methylase
MPEIRTLELLPYANNARTHSADQVAQVAASIREFGFTNPILIDENNVIIAGHGRLEAAKSLGMESVPVRVLDNLTDDQKKAYVIADNQLALNAGWDIELLKIELEELKLNDFDLALTGFDDDFISGLLHKDTEGLTDEDATPEPPEDPVSVLGDVWILGNHRVMCGDSTSIDAVERLMDGQKADMVFTDPPYNIDFSGTMGCTSKNGKMVSMKDGYKVPNSQHEDIKNDKKNEDDFNVFISDIVSNIKEYCVGGWYICFSSSTLHELLIPLINNDMKWKSIIIWNKNQSPMGGGHFRKKYEPIVYGYFSNFFYGKEYAEDDVWDVKRTLKNDLHPTMKPIELVERAIGFSSNSGGIVLDFFGGSGSTLIACEKTNRISYNIELDPKYCDVIITRWQDFTGKEAVNATGETFNQMKEQREAA